MTEPTQKLDIEKDGDTLKIYMFTVQGGPMKFDLPEDFKAVLAYNDEDALTMVKKDYSVGLSLFIKKRAQVEAKKLIDKINLQLTVPQQVEVISPPPPTEEKTVQDFVCGMMLIADKYVVNKRDQATLKRIIGRIKV